MSAIQTPELPELLLKLVDEQLDQAEMRRLCEILRHDPSSEEFYDRFITVHGLLTWHYAPPLISNSSSIPEEDWWDRRATLGGATVEPSSPSLAPPSPPAPTFLPATFHDVLGCFPEGMPLAYLLAVLITGLGLLIGSVIHVAEPTEVPRQSASLPSPLSPLPSVVGRITGMVDCKWEKEGSGFRVQGSGIEKPKAPVSQGQTFALVSGLMEITYNTGAKVILQGPVTYEAEVNGGYLAVGKLTGKLEKRGERRGERGEEAANHQIPNPKSQILNPSPLLLPSPLFVIRTPTATVTDLGTEFGVEVARDGACEVHVIQGQVKAERVGQSGAASERVLLSQKQAVRFSPNKPGYTIIAAAPGRFQTLHTGVVRTPPLRWPLMDKTLVAWVSLANTRQRGAGVLWLTNVLDYDSIALGELEPGKWMAGSEQHARTQKDQSQNPIETAGPNELVQIAIVYDWTSVTIYRNGKMYVSYDNEGRRVFPRDAILLIGKQYLGVSPVSLPTLAGTVEEARLYNVALLAQDDRFAPAERAAANRPGGPVDLQGRHCPRRDRPLPDGPVAGQGPNSRR